MNKKILITVGGTGGHVFPALSLGTQLKEMDSSLDLLYAGGNLTLNPYFNRDVFSHKTISCATFRSKNPFSILKTLGKIALGVKESSYTLNNFDPDLVVGFGSYYTLPMLIASKFKSVPFILHEANSVPGKVNRLLSKYAKITGIHFPETAQHLKGTSLEVGVPLRHGYKKGFHSKEFAKEYFELDKNRFTVLVFGGSQGAIKLNKVVSHSFCQYMPELKSSWQIIHFSGNETTAKTVREEYEKANIKACVKPFESRMDLAWQAADFCITRSGAGTIAEQLEFEVPGILIPFPFATDNHQETNADFLVSQVGGAIKLLEGELTAESLAQTIKYYNAERRGKAMLAMQRYKHNNRPKEFCDLVFEELNKL